ncbi:hypothetical protein DAPPUDRAFT_327600 [Daphnia pulex]|uniref:Uncharacterized protein n=1 Tax=Daphnia pulex TaxID=6669 RepID=E9HB41_DAPPU|nr:hypothetical protein DAPPUDRAFT_327600 [Daphnia pulex]|eukprot:EFX71020.1 hypothetical protein DAPPUDRAFT_327600 [Daphnia pulex]
MERPTRNKQMPKRFDEYVLTDDAHEAGRGRSRSVGRGHVGNNAGEAAIRRGRGGRGSGGRGHVGNDAGEAAIQYLIVMKPVSITLDCFQAEKNCYLGMVLPAIVKLKGRLNELTELHSFSEYRDLLVENI